MFIITLLDYVNILVILYFGWATSREDLKYGKISNENILVMISIGFFLFLLKIFLFLILGGKPNSSYIIDYLTNVLIMAFSVFYLWKGKLLNAGDSKLILAYTFLVPVNFYHYGYVKFFPGTALLINIFTPIFIYLSFLALKYSSLEDKLNALKKAINLKLILFAYIAIIAFMWLVRVIIPFFKTRYNFSLSIILIFLIMILLSKLKKSKYFIIAVFLLRMVFKDFPSLYELKFDTLIIFFLFFIRAFLVNLASVTFKKQVKVEELEVGMELLLDDKNLGGKKVTLKNRKALIKALKERNIKYVEVKVPTAFAHFVFLGVLLTLLFRGDIFSALRFLPFSR